MSSISLSPALQAPATAGPSAAEASFDLASAARGAFGPGATTPQSAAERNAAITEANDLAKKLFKAAPAGPDGFPDQNSDQYRAGGRISQAASEFHKLSSGGGSAEALDRSFQRLNDAVQNGQDHLMR